MMGMPEDITDRIKVLLVRMNSDVDYVCPSWPSAFGGKSVTFNKKLITEWLEDITTGRGHLVRRHMMVLNDIWKQVK